MVAKKPSWLCAATAGTLICGTAAVLNWPDAARATPSRYFASRVTRAFFTSIRVLSDTHDGKNASVRIVADEPSDVYVVTNTIAPGGYSGWHTHPGPSVVLVKSGTATVYLGDDPNCLPSRFAAGSGFIDPGGGHVHMVRNEGTVQLVTVAFQIVPAGGNRRVDAPVSGHCRF
jgi:quercetin dioxygenase-like cupin family protein